MYVYKFLGKFLYAKSNTQNLKRVEEKNKWDVKFF